MVLHQALNLVLSPLNLAGLLKDEEQDEEVSGISEGESSVKVGRGEAGKVLVESKLGVIVDSDTGDVGRDSISVSSNTEGPAKTSSGVRVSGK